MKTLSFALLIAQSAAQLLLDRASARLGGAAHSTVRNPYQASSIQQPLSHLQSVDGVELPPFKAGNYSTREQNSTTCATEGERQWTGTVDISDERRLFFWHFDSRNDPENDPVIIWLNGGPGASSMRGLFTELGPCTIEVGANKTTPNPHSWNNNASLLVIDQPAGVGFSDIKPGGTYAWGDVEAAKDLQEFLRIFFSDVFPEKKHLPIHFAGESYGGHYVPVTLKHILDSREFKSPGAFWGNITSMILVNALIDRLQMPIGIYELMCTDYRGKLWNETVCEKQAQGMPGLEEMNLACELSRDGRICLAPADVAAELSMNLIFEEDAAGKRNKYNIQKRCFDTPGCEDDTRGDFTAYLNQPEVLEAIGFPRSYTYENTDEGAGYGIGDSLEGYVSTAKQLSSVLDASKKYAHRKGVQDIRLLVLNGNEDSLCNTPGIKWVYDRLAWSGAAGYRARKWNTLEELGLKSDVATGEWKSSEDGRLLLLGVDGAGHMLPQDQPEAADWLIRKWTAGDI